MRLIKHFLRNYRLEGLIFTIIGLLLIIVPDPIIDSAIGIIMGILLIIINIPDAIYGSDTIKKWNSTVIRSYILIFIGICIIIWGLGGFATIWGIMILIPLLYNFFTSPNKSVHFRRNVGKYLFAIILIILGFQYINIAGIILLVHGLILFAIGYFFEVQVKKQKRNRNIIEGEFVNVERDEK